MRKVKLEDIRIDGGTQQRIVIDQPTVYRYRDDMKAGDEFPLMQTVFDGTNYWLVDGFHRWHAYKLLGIKSIDIEYKPGTLEEAQVMSFGANAKHGLPRTNKDKRRVVEVALEHPLTKDKSDREIAKICCVSAPFVGAVRKPEVKEQQQENIAKHYEKKNSKKDKKEEKGEKCNSITPPEPTKQPIDEPDPHAGEGPDDEELLANQKKHEADLKTLANFLDANDKLAYLYAENERLNRLVAMKELRITELMNEKNTAVKMVMKLQKDLDKLKVKKT